MGSRGRRSWLTGWLLLTAFVAFAGAANAAPGLHVIPFPGTPDASPASHIIFSSLRPSELRSVSVTGSTSGQHQGQLIGLPDNAGTAFVAQHPFIAGESVTVTATVRSDAAGWASGASGAETFSFSFTVAMPPPPHGTTAKDRPDRGTALSWPSPLARTSAGPTQSFHSAPGLHPPAISATSDPDQGSGDIFLTPRFAEQDGPMILDGRGRLLWFRPLDGFATNLEVQRYRNRPVLTWSKHNAGGGVEDVIMNRSYEITHVLRGDEGYVLDQHEFQLASNGTAWVDARKSVRVDLSSVGGSPNGSVSDCVIQERDVKTNRLLWEWHALGHIPLSASVMPVPTQAGPYDAFHLNSIQQLPNGNLLVSVRNTSAVYEIDKETGDVIWTLGGKDSTFKMTPAAQFEWQHDAKLNPGHVLSVFDDASSSKSAQAESQSSAKLIDLSPRTRTASLVRAYTHTPPVITGAEGSAQLLPNHDVFVGWGRQPDFSEFAPGGRQIFSGVFAGGVSSYRAYRFPWKGQPLGRPAIALARNGDGTVAVSASWNGATQVATWRVLAGARPGSLRPTAHAKWSGFETVMTLQPWARYVAVEAVDAHGQVLGTSQVRVVPA